MSFGDDGPSAPYIPPPPPREELMDVVDKVSGTQAITVIGPDGKKKRVVDRLPRTPEEERFHQAIKEQLDRSLIVLRRLNEYDPSAVQDFAPFLNVINDLNQERSADMAALSNLPDFARYVDDFKSMERNIINQEFNKQENQTQEYLNRRGYNSSTANAEMKAALTGERARALEQSDIRGNMAGEQLKSADMANRMNEYGFREQGRQGRLAASEAEYRLAVNQRNQLAQQRQQAIANQAGLFNIAAGISGEDANRALMGKAPELANQIFQQSNADSLNRYSAGVNAQQANYQNQLAEYNSRGPSFGDTMLNIGGTLGTGMLFASPNSLAGRLGAKLF